MKPFLSVLLTFACLLAILPLSVSAKNGDIAGAVYDSDIRAYINGHPIESYNVDGYDGKNASYFSGNHVQLGFSAEGASIRFAFFQNDKGLGSIAAALDKCTNWDYRGLYPGFTVEPRADIADLLTLTIEGEEKEIHTVGIIQGNGHVDYILTVDGCYPREAVSSVRITCRIPAETP